MSDYWYGPNATEEPIDPVPQRPRVFVNVDRTTLVEMWPNGTCTVATRENTDQIWSPPTYLKEEK